MQYFKSRSSDSIRCFFHLFVHPGDQVEQMRGQNIAANWWEGVADPNPHPAPHPTHVPTQTHTQKASKMFVFPLLGLFSRTN